jgi:hypothetical protein
VTEQSRTDIMFYLLIEDAVFAAISSFGHEAGCRH